MDSRMLNVFHEDPFDGSFIKYEAEQNFWSTDNDNTMSMQLSDTLNGILPIPPTDDALLRQNLDDLNNSKTLFICNDFAEQHLSDCESNDLNAQVYQVFTQNDGETAFEKHEIERDDGDAQSQCSHSTFRTRTDSSSIADYESHSSDYEDDDFVIPTDSISLKVLSHDETRKDRTISSNTVGSDVDGLGFSIDANNFDLADFITKDDFALNMNTMRTKENPRIGDVPLISTERIISNKTALPTTQKPIVVISSKKSNSDDDSDSIIDVETVDVDESLWAAQTFPVADELSYVDNVKADPSWSPKPAKKQAVPKEHKSSSHQQPTCSNVVPEKSAPVVTISKAKPGKNICLVPNKKQCEILKRKVGVPSTKGVTKKLQETTKSSPKIQRPPVKPNDGVIPVRTGLGLSGKNLALLKHERDSIAATNVTVETLQVQAAAPPKRKLNLEEYKQRRSGVVQATPTSNVAHIPNQSKVQPKTNLALEKSPLSAAAAAARNLPKLTNSPHKLQISNVLNNLKCPESQMERTDPITAAKNKVLRMLEMKRAQQLKIIDSVAKVPRVTKLPPLKDIVKNTYCMEAVDEPIEPQSPLINKLHANYEEIIIVSVSCNTDITIPPLQEISALKDNASPPSCRSLLKSSVLLYNISNAKDTNKNMTNSLIASIQCEVVKQNSDALVSTATTKGTMKSKKDQQHGEDMVIMHLPKDRVRKVGVCMATQTDLQPEFPMLPLPTLRKSRTRTRRTYRKRRMSSNNSNASSDSHSESSSCSSSESFRSRSNSVDRLRQSDATVACGNGSIGGGYSSRSTRRHRSSVSSSSLSEAGKYDREQRRQRRTSYNKRRSKKKARSSSSSSVSDCSYRSRSPQHQQRSCSRSISPPRYGKINGCNTNNNRRNFVDRNVSQPAVEERRIVYVGRIEQETTKEMLRRKFLTYGPIKQITIHYKENDMKYGFVTYERAQDAFTAIDSSPRDQQINMYDISFGGRRAFCRASYADLDNAGTQNYSSYMFPKASQSAPKEEDSFEALLLKVKAKLNKPTSSHQDGVKENSSHNINNNNNDKNAHSQI